MIVFDEKAHAKKMLRDGFITPNQEIKDIFIFAKYLYYLDNDKFEVNQKLKEFIVKYRNEYSDNIRNGIARKTTNSAKMGTLVFDKKIQIYESELNVVNSLNTNELKKLMFSYIVLSKFSNGLFKISRNELFKLADIKIHNRNKPKLIYELNKTKNTFTIIKKNTTLRGIDIKSIGKVILEFIVDENFIFQYLYYIGDKKITECNKCRRLILKTSNKKKYCKACGEKVNRQKTLENYYRNKF